MTPIEDNTISPHEVEAGDLLWKYIAELHRANGTEQVNFIARTSVDPAEMAALMPLAETLHAEFQQNAERATGEVMARAQLLAVMQSSPPVGTPWLPRALSARARDIMTLVGLLFGLGGAIWFVYVQTRPPAYVRPVYDYNNTPSCETPLKSAPSKNGARKAVNLSSK